LGNKRLQDAALGRRQTIYVGGELLLGLQMNNIGVQLALPVLAGEVKGLTRGQLVISVSLAGEIKLT
jgi:hypothetical protein